MKEPYWNPSITDTSRSAHYTVFLLDPAIISASEFPEQSSAISIRKTSYRYFSLLQCFYRIHKAIITRKSPLKLNGLFLN